MHEPAGQLEYPTHEDDQYESEAPEDEREDEEWHREEAYEQERDAFGGHSIQGRVSPFIVFVVRPSNSFRNGHLITSSRAANPDMNRTIVIPFKWCLRLSGYYSSTKPPMDPREGGIYVTSNESESVVVGSVAALQRFGRSGNR